MILLLSVAVLVALALGQEPTAPPKQPSVLIVVGTEYAPYHKLDFAWMKQLHERGLLIDAHYNNEHPRRPFTWDLIKNYNSLLFLNMPAADGKAGGDFPDRQTMQALLDRYLKAGGGVFLMPGLGEPSVSANRGTLRVAKDWEAHLDRWGAKIPLDRLRDPATERKHPRSTVPFLYTDKIAPSPVSEGVKGIWFPSGGEDTWAFYAWGSPIEVSKDWTVVARGSDMCFTRPMVEVGNSLEHGLLATRFHRTNPNTPPALFAIRQQDAGRLALTVEWPIFTLYGGLSWIHDGAMINKGLDGKPSDFGRLFENTLRWLAAPSLQSGALGGYAQNPLVLVPPNLRKNPQEYFPEFDSYQNMTPPGNVYRGLVGARTRYSTGQGTVAEYAAAAQAAGLDFVIFLEEFGKDTLTGPNYRKLEADCKVQSTDKLLLLPGFSFKNNIGNHMFAYGYGLAWPTDTQVTGAKKNEWRLQCFDKDGKLAENDEDAKNWIWKNSGALDGTVRNVGYYNFAAGAGVPVRNLRLFGILAVMTYLDGKLVEDLTPEYLDYVRDGDAPLAGAVEIVRSPAELTRAVNDGHYLTHAAANSLADVPGAMRYGHAYGRANVYPSSGPRIKSWAGTQRVLTFAGESFLPVRYRIRPLCWVTSDVGLKEIVIYDDCKPYRRFLLNGAKEFKQTFEWAYDRQRNLTLEITDSQGRRALSAAFEMWSDANFHQWCGDRQNGAIWHGPGTVGGVPGIPMTTLSVGPTWDGGPPNQPFAWYNGWLVLRTKTGEVRGPTEGNQFLTCIDETVFNTAIIAGCDYAPGFVGTAYSTLGPIHPNPLMTAENRCTTFVRRPLGPSLDSHPMWPERAGGMLTMSEGSVTLKQDVDLTGAMLFGMKPHSFPPDQSNVPIFALRRNNAARPLCGALGSFWDRATGFRQAVGAQDLDSGRYLLDAGGYTALMPSGEGFMSALFNLGELPLHVGLGGSFDYYLGIEKRRYQAGETLRWRYLSIVDPLDQPAHNLARVERLRQYYGLDGQGGGSGIVLKRGKLLRHFGVVDIAPAAGIVEFEVPEPAFPLDIPLGLRFIGFNPNWSIGQFQIVGYSTGFYTDGRNVYRNLAPDDRNIVHLGVYTTGVPKTHCVVGHPVQCDNPKLIVEFAQLNSKPVEYRVAVNNPTDQPTKTILKKSMELPGFDFRDTPVDVPAGGYAVVREK